MTDNHKKPQKGKNRFNDAASEKPLTLANLTRRINAYEDDKNLQALLSSYSRNFLSEHEADLTALGGWVMDELDEVSAYSSHDAPPYIDPRKVIDGEMHGKVHVNKRFEAARQKAYGFGGIAKSFDDQNPQPYFLGFLHGYFLSHSSIDVHCEYTMTGADAYTLEKWAPQDVKDKYLPELTRMDGQTKTGGTWATEERGGSDVGQATRTTVTAQPDGSVTLNGVKWFASNASGQITLATARVPGAGDDYKALGLYLVPGEKPDGTENSYYARLKDKLGTKGLATAEIHLEDAYAVEVVAPPKGLAAMMTALEYSRIHNAVSAAGITHRALLEARTWAEHRTAFGKNLIDHVMIRQNLLDMVMQHEAATALAFEAAINFDIADKDPHEAPWLRLVTALAKHRTADQSSWATELAKRIVGGNGVDERFPVARQLRDASVLPVWEGPTNIQALEILRILTKQPELVSTFSEFVSDIAADVPAPYEGLAQQLSHNLAQVQSALQGIAVQPADREYAESVALNLMDLMADTLTAGLLLREGTEGLQNGSARKMLIARRYCEQTLSQSRYPYLGGGDPAMNFFDEIISYEDVDPAAAQNALTLQAGNGRAPKID